MCIRSSLATLHFKCGRDQGGLNVHSVPSADVPLDATLHSIDDAVLSSSNWVLELLEAAQD